MYFFKIVLLLRHNCNHHRVLIILSYYYILDALTFGALILEIAKNSPVNTPWIYKSTKPEPTPPNSHTKSQYVPALNHARATYQTTRDHPYILFFVWFLPRSIIIWVSSMLLYVPFITEYSIVEVHWLVHIAGIFLTFNNLPNCFTKWLYYFISTSSIR